MVAILFLNMSRGAGWAEKGFLSGAVPLIFSSFLGSINFSVQSKCFVVLGKIHRVELKTACHRQATFRLSQCFWSVNNFVIPSQGL
jgi:hypothetical protein